MGEARWEPRFDVLDFLKIISQTPLTNKKNLFIIDM